MELSKILARDDVPQDVKEQLLSCFNEYEQREKYLREIERLYQLITENMADTISIQDMDLNFTYISPSIMNLRGLTPEEAMRQSIDQIMTAESLNLAVEAFGEEMLLEASGNADPRRSRILELEEYRKDGSTVWVEATLSYIRDDSGNPVGILSATRDISARKQAEKELLREKNFTEALLESIPGLLYVYDRDGNFIRWNKRHETMTGYSAEELSAMTPLDWFEGEDFARVKETIEQVFSAGYGELEAHLLTKNCGKRHMALNGVRLILDGKTYFTGVGIDITERKQAEENLRASQQMLKDVINSISVRVFWKDKGGRFLGCNKVFAQDAGFTDHRDIIGKNDFEMRWRDQADRYRNDDYQIIKSGCSKLNIEEPQTTPDGSTITLLTNKIPLRNPEGALIGVLGTYIDISERKQAEEALHIEKERFRAISEQAPFGMAIIGQDGLFEYLNPKFIEMFGYVLSDIPNGKTWYRKAFPDPDYRHQIIGKWLSDLKVFKQGEQRPETYTVCCKDGSSKIINFTPVQLETGENFLVCEDITERRLAEEEKHRLEKHLRSVAKMEAIDILAGGIAHDFNNLLMGIQGNASLALMKIDPINPSYAHLALIAEYVQSGAGLTRQLLDFARQGRFEVKTINANSIIEKSSKMFGRTKKEISIDRHYKKDLWNVEADSGQIEQVMMNLYVNAWQAMPAGGNLSLVTENVILDETTLVLFSLNPGRYVKISVSDTGIGMDKKTMKRIFEPFFTTKKMGRGTGLGLASVYGIIKSHSGAIDVQSEPGEGTTFIIYLPASNKEAIAENMTNGMIANGNETILLVDDEDMILTVNTAQLESMGYRVCSVTSGPEAIAICQEKKIDLVILDMTMPGMSGEETFFQLRNLNPRIKVLLSSGYALNGKIKAIIEQGCNGFLQKPFLTSQLSQKVREILES